MVEAGESEYSRILKTRKLLIFRDAKNAENVEIAPNWAHRARLNPRGRSSYHQQLSS